MKILDLCDFYSERGGGVRSYLEKLGRAVAPAGHELVIVAPGPRDEETTLAPRATLVRYGSPAMPYDPTYHWPVRLGKMRELVKRHRPDVLQASSPFVPALVTGTDRSAKVRAYVHHSNPIGCYLEPLAARSPAAMREWVTEPGWSWLRKVAGSCDVTVVAGTWLERELTQHRCQRVKAVPFGIIHEDFGPERTDAALRERLLGPLAGDPRAALFLIAGRLAADKRQALVVEGLRLVARSRPVALVVLGDGPERERLQELARNLPFSTFMKFTRDRAEYATLLASVDALVHGSLCETYGFVLAETLASGTPLVVPDRGGAAALADPAASEKYPTFGGPEEVAAAVERLLARPVAATRTAARAAGRREPSIGQHFQDLFSLYESMLFCA